MADRESIMNRVRALRARAADEASSAAEAEAAARRAAKLISENELTERDLMEIGVDGVGEGIHNKGRRTMHPVMRIASSAICNLTECQALWCAGEVTFVGTPSDVEFSIYLSELIQGAADRAWKAFLKQSGIHSTAHKRQSFMLGFGETVGTQLTRMGQERRKRRSRPETGTDLVVMKDQLVQSYMDAKYGELGQFRSRKARTPDIRCALGGLQAGARLDIHTPVTDADDAAQSALQ